MSTWLDSFLKVVHESVMTNQPGNPDRKIQTYGSAEEDGIGPHLKPGELNDSPEETSETTTALRRARSFPE